MSDPVHTCTPDAPCGVCANCLLTALATMPDAIDRICAQPPARLVGMRSPLIERLRADRVMLRAKREEKDA
jgi:hypothetical protein